MLYYLILAAATVLLGAEFALAKKCQLCQSTGLLPGLRYNVLLGLFTALIFLAVQGFRPEFSVFSLVMAFAMSLLVIVYTIIGLRILSMGGMAQYALFLMGGGMILPYLFGVIFLNEVISFARVLGLVLIVVALFLNSGGKLAAKRSVFLLCICVFFLNGFVSIVSKCHQIDTTHNAVSSTGFVFLTGITKLSTCGIALRFVPKGKSAIPFQPVKALPLILCAAAVSGLSYTLQLIGAANLPATVVYPMITGGGVIFSALAGLLLFKKKLTALQRTGIGLCFVGTLLFL